jgi:hypothetical protein
MKGLSQGPREHEQKPDAAPLTALDGQHWLAWDGMLKSVWFLEEATKDYRAVVRVDLPPSIHLCGRQTVQTPPVFLRGVGCPNVLFVPPRIRFKSARAREHTTVGVHRAYVHSTQMQKNRRQVSAGGFALNAGRRKPRPITKRRDVPRD